MPRPKKSPTPKLNELTKIHGKIEQSQPTTIEQLMGLSGAKYGTTDIKEYSDKLNKMNWDELRSHAFEEGLLPGDVEDKERIKNILIRMFNEYRAKFTKQETKVVNASNSKKVSFVEEAIKRAVSS